MSQISLPGVFSSDTIVNDLRGGGIPVGMVIRADNPFDLPVALLDFYVHRFFWDHCSDAMRERLIDLGFSGARSLLPNKSAPSRFVGCNDSKDPWLIGRPLLQRMVGDEGRSFLRTGYISYKPQASHRCTMGLCLLIHSEGWKHPWGTRYSNAVTMGSGGARHNGEKERLANLIEAWAVCGERTPYLYYDGMLHGLMDWGSGREI